MASPVFFFFPLRVQIDAWLIWLSITQSIEKLRQEKKYFVDCAVAVSFHYADVFWVYTSKCSEKRREKLRQFPELFKEKNPLASIIHIVLFFESEESGRKKREKIKKAWLR